jgi:hypothetical protein
VRTATVEGLTPDGRTLLLRLEGEVVHLPLAEVRQAQRSAPPLPLGGGPTPREIQSRIRHGESADDIARAYGLPVESIARYEGPVLAERAHHVRLARLADVDGRTVEDRVVEHAVRLDAGPLVWDCFQTDPRRWEVTATAGDLVVRLAWDPGTRRADPLGEMSRQALGRAPLPEEALESVLRQVRTPRARREPPPPAPTVASPPPPAPTAAPPPTPAAPVAPAPAAPRPPAPGAPRKRAQVPLWDDISAGVSGTRRPGRPAAAAQPEPSPPAEQDEG